MSNILELLKNEKVEWKKLCEVCGTITTGKLNANKKVENGKYPFFTCDEKPYKIDTYAFDEEAILISGNGSKVGHINYYKGKFNAYQRTYVLYNFKYNCKYILYYLKCKLQNYILLNKMPGSIPYITLPLLQNFEIPIPSLETQAEIVKILDEFEKNVTELKAALKIELELRKKQYSYYRDKLLSEDYLNKHELDGNVVEWKKLKDVANIQRGASPRPISNFLTNDENGVNWIKISDTTNSKYITSTKEKITEEGAKKSRVLKKGTLILSNSMSYGKPFILKIDGAIHDGWALLSNFEDKFIADFLYYYLTTDKVISFWNNKINSSTVSNLNSEIIGSLTVPIVSINLQEKIVNILDKFETIVNDISDGLPKEIDFRTKQYEHYREKLLTFNKN